jgi:hypothetical protein
MANLTDDPALQLGPRLDSWKEIAAFFGRRVRTVQRWESLEGMPVHRHQHEKGSSVYAYVAELEAWARRRQEAPPAAEPCPAPEAPLSTPRRSLARVLRPVLGAAVLSEGLVGVSIPRQSRGL